MGRMRSPSGMVVRFVLKLFRLAFHARLGFVVDGAGAEWLARGLPEHEVAAGSAGALEVPDEQVFEEVDDDIIR